MHVRCTACGHRFDADGYRDLRCPGCGTFVTPLPGQCPSCAEPLTSRELAGVAYEECDRCEGTFLTHAAIDALLAEAARSAETVALLRPREPRPNIRPQARCPVCTDVMARRLSPTGAGIVLDVCKEHGAFFAAGDVARLIAFVCREARQRAAELAEDPYAEQRAVAEEPPRYDNRWGTHEPEIARSILRALGL